MGVLEKLARWRCTWTFQAENLAEYTGKLKNPARGWYQIHTFPIEKEPDLDELEWCIDKQDALAVLIIDIGSVRNQDLGQKELNRIRKILTFFREYHFDVILRMVYDHEGQAIEREPDIFSQIQRHVEQLWGTLSDFEETIFIFQGMLIGNWGEMHTSKFLATEKLARLAESLRDNKTYRTFLSVRRPKFWRLLHKPDTNPAERPADLMGLFDDAILGSHTDLGTYGDKDRATAGWESAWRREDELEFEDVLCRTVPNGGEVVYGENYTDNLSIDEILAILQKKHITYLNRLHDARVLEKWKGAKAVQFPAWKDRTVYEYIGAHLGYRFLIRNVYVRPDKSNSRDFLVIEICVENCGFANIYEETELSLLCEKGNGQTEIVVLSEDMRKWNPGEQNTILYHLRIFEGKLYLTAKRKKDGAVVYFANGSNGEEKICLGVLALK